MIVLENCSILNNINVFDVDNVRNIFEIKSKMKLERVRKINNTLKALKSSNSNIKGGIIYYELDCKEQNLLKKFGFIFDKDIQSYIINEDAISEFDSIDYIVSFDKNNEFVLSRDISGKFMLDKKISIISKFLMIFN